MHTLGRPYGGFFFEDQRSLGYGEYINKESWVEGEPKPFAFSTHTIRSSILLCQKTLVTYLHLNPRSSCLYLHNRQNANHIPRPLLPCSRPRRRQS